MASRQDRRDLCSKYGIGKASNSNKVGFVGWPLANEYTVRSKDSDPGRECSYV